MYPTYYKYFLVTEMHTLIQNYFQYSVQNEVVSLFIGGSL